MSTLKTHNLQSPDAGSVNIALTANAGMIVTGISTFNERVNVGSLGVTTNFTVAGISTFANTARFSGGDVIFSGTNNFLQWDKSADYLRFMDGVYASFGNSDDLRIIHNGSNSYIKNDTGWLNLLSDTIFLGNNADTKAYLKGYNGGSVEIFYNHSKKFETTNTGAVVTGVLTATSFSGDGSSLSNLPASAPVGGSSSNKVFFENDKVVSVNYQITSTKNAMTAGPVSVNAGIAVTVPSGCSWTIV